MVNNALEIVTRERDAHYIKKVLKKRSICILLQWDVCLGESNL